MRKHAVIMLLFFLSTCLNACYREGSIDATGRSDIHHIVVNSVPYVLQGDRMLDYVWYKETDAYGRELFLYQTELYMSTIDLDIWVICQKTEKNQTYYYEDFCYYVCQEGTQISDTELALLKKQNDWGKPLDEERMTSVYCGESNAENRNYEYYLQFEKGDKLKESIRESFEISESSYIYLDGLGCDAQGNAIVFVLIKQSQNKMVSEVVEGRYLVRYDSDLTPSMIDYISVNEGFNLQELIHGFRAFHM